MHSLPGAGGEERSSSADLLIRWQQGDSQAAEELFAAYAARLTHLAQQHLSHAVQQREEEADIVQSVFRTFFRRSKAGEFTIQATSDLWCLLVRITLFKARAHGRYHSARRRAVRAEAGDAALAQVLARDPSPADAVAVVDLIDVLLQGQPPLFVEVLHLRLQGNTVTQIAQHLQLSRKTVHQVIRRLKDRLQALEVQNSP